MTDGQEIRGQLSSYADVDGFVINMDQAGTIEVAFDAPTDSYLDYFTVRLLQSDGTIIAAQETGKDTSFSAGVEAAGEYFVVVTSESYYHDSGEYGVTARTSSAVGRKGEGKIKKKHLSCKPHSFIYILVNQWGKNLDSWMRMELLV